VSQGSRAPDARQSEAVGPGGAALYHRVFDASQQKSLVSQIGDIVRVAPLFQPVMPRTAKPFSVAMTNCGQLGWVSDRDGYRYQTRHPLTDAAWPRMPGVLIDLWRRFAPEAVAAEACLINIYDANAKMGSHQDRDEEDFSAPIISVSLGCEARFHIGGMRRFDPKTRFTLRSGDVLVMGGPARLAFHGIDSVRAGTSELDLSRVAPGCARINLTLRRVTAVA